MSAVTKLHRLLSGAEWNHDLRYEVEDYLAANCTVQEIIELCVHAKLPTAVPPTGHLDKLELLENLLSRVVPADLVAAWDQVLAERAKRKEQRTRDRAALDVPHTDATMAQVLRLLGPLEIVALYYGHVRLLRDLQDRQKDELLLNRKTRSQLTRISTAHLYRMRLDSALEWLATEDPAKAETVAEHLAEMPNEQATLMAQVMKRRIKNSAGKEAG